MERTSDHRRHDRLEAYGSAASFDEIAGKGLARRDETIIRSSAV